MRLRLGTVRRAALPSVERGGSLTDLAIPSDAGLAELTHAIAFEGRFIGVLFNQFGPRPNKLATYLTEKGGDTEAVVSIDGLLRSDVSTQLLGLESIKLIDLAVQHDAIGKLSEYDAGLADAFEAARSLTDAQQVRLTLQAEPHSQNSLASSAKALVQRLLQVPGLSTVFERFQVRGVDASLGKTVEIDLLKEFLVSAQEVVFMSRRSRSLDNESAYAAIERAYTELKREIASASVLVSSRSLRGTL
jgi:hypothetical protein